jgi:hypothetical protein
LNDGIVDTLVSVNVTFRFVTFRHLELARYSARL